MKKSMISLGVLIALGAIWAGGAWYTGKIAEEQYQTQINNLNHQFAAQNMSEVKIEHATFDRGVFSSDIGYDVVVNGENQLVLPFKGKLYHGPFTLNNFKFALASADLELAKTEQTQYFFDASNGKTPIHSTYTLYYNRDVQGSSTFSDGRYQTAQNQIAWKEASVDFRLDKQMAGQVNGKVSKLELSSLDQKNNIELENVTLLSDSESTPWEHIKVGTQTIYVGSVKAKLGEGDEAVLFNTQNVNLHTQSERNDQFINQALDLSLAGMNVQQQSFGDMKLNLKWNHLDGEIMNEMLAAMLQGDMHVVQMQALKLLEKQPHFLISPFSLHNSEGDFNANVNIELADGNLQMKALRGKFLELFKQFKVSLDADKANLVNMALSLNHLKNKEVTKEQVSQEIDVVLREMISKNIVLDKGDRIEGIMQLVDGKLILNGEEIPEESIKMALFMLAMGMGRK